MQESFVVATDRGGHLHNALQLIDQMQMRPSHIVTSVGPDVQALKSHPEIQVVRTPELFSWLGKRRFLNPFKVLYHVWVSLWVAIRLRPRVVVSLGASNVVVFCYWARLLGARIFHVECMNQVVTKSVTGKMLYPICENLYVQWESLLPFYGPKARFEGWVL